MNLKEPSLGAGGSSASHWPWAGPFKGALQLVPPGPCCGLSDTASGSLVPWARGEGRRRKKSRCGKMGWDRVMLCRGGSPEVTSCDVTACWKDCLCCRARPVVLGPVVNEGQHGLAKGKKGWALNIQTNSCTVPPVRGDPSLPHSFLLNVWFILSDTLYQTPDSDCRCRDNLWKQWSSLQTAVLPPSCTQPFLTWKWERSWAGASRLAMWLLALGATCLGFDYWIIPLFLCLVSEVYF